MWSWWLLGGAAVALGMAAPNLVWEAGHHWATLEFLRHLRAANASTDLVQFVPVQLLLMTIGGTVLWIVALVALTRRPEWRAQLWLAYGYGGGLRAASSPSAGRPTTSGPGTCPWWRWAPWWWSGPGRGRRLRVLVLITVVPDCSGPRWPHRSFPSPRPWPPTSTRATRTSGACSAGPMWSARSPPRPTPFRPPLAGMWSSSPPTTARPGRWTSTVRPSGSRPPSAGTTPSGSGATGTRARGPRSSPSGCRRHSSTATGPRWCLASTLGVGGPPIDPAGAGGAHLDLPGPAGAVGGHLAGGQALRLTAITRHRTPARHRRPLGRGHRGPAGRCRGLRSPSTWSGPALSPRPPVRLATTPGAAA